MSVPHCWLTEPVSTLTQLRGSSKGTKPRKLSALPPCALISVRVQVAGLAFTVRDSFLKTKSKYFICHYAEKQDLGEHWEKLLNASICSDISSSYS